MKANDFEDEMNSTLNPIRFLNFGFGASGANGQGNAAGGSGGSGNFLFDIIRVSTSFKIKLFMLQHYGKFLKRIRKMYIIISYSKIISVDKQLRLKPMIINWSLILGNMNGGKAKSL